MPVGGALEVGQVSHEDCWEGPQRPVTFAELRVGGIDFPAAVVSELELNGYEIERVYDRVRPIGVRLLEPERCNSAVAHRRHRWPWPTAGKRRTT